MSRLKCRVLVVADEYPWPPINGYRMRLANVIAALSSVGDVDVFCVTSDEHHDGSQGPPDGVEVGTVTVVRAPRATGVRTAARWLISRLPRRVVWLDWREAEHSIDRWKPSYDLVWYSHADPWLALHRGVAARHTIVDLDNLEDDKIAQRRRALARRRRPEDRSARGVLRRLVSRVADMTDQVRWAHQQRRIAASVDTVVVCSETDRERFGASNTAVVPNGYELRGALGPGAHGRPTVTMVGLMIYEPNDDGARFFVDEALPLLRELVPDVELRLVGRHDGAFDDLAGTRGVVVTGEVPEIGTELERADVIVVPLRFGGGTRIKLLEAFANRRPVVATSIGCQGIDVTPGRHLLVADDGASLARSCARLLGDVELARELSDNAFELYHSSYRWDTARETIAAVALSAVGAGTTHDEAVGFDESS